MDFHPSFPREKVDRIDESVLHVTLREAKEEVGIDAGEIEILGRLGPPALSLSGLPLRPYAMNFKCCGRAFPPNNLGEGVSIRKAVKVIPKGRRHIAVTFAYLVVPGIISSRGLRCLNRFTDPRYLREPRFCESTSYWARKVTDLVAPGIEWSSAGANPEDEVDEGFGRQLEARGLPVGISICS